MEDFNDLKIGRLKRIITIRMKEEDYIALLRISENKRSNVSKIIRLMLSHVLDIVKENNSKAK